MTTVRRWLPGLGQIAELRLSAIPREIGAGISVAAIAVPIGLAYAKLIGVPAEVGLYASILPTAAYALFGPSSRYLIVGPDTAVCLLLATTITQLGVTAPDERTAMAAGLSLMLGLACIAAALLRLGNVANLISRPVLIGYLAGIAVTLLVSQLSSLTAVTLTSPGLFRPFIELVRRGAEIHWLTLGLGVGFFALLRLMKSFVPRIPGAVVVLVLGILLSAMFDLSARGVATVGEIPAGLPGFAIPSVKGEPATLALAMVGLLVISFSSGILTVRSFGQRLGQRSDPNRELVGFAAADIAAGLSHGFAVTGADSRTAVAISAGGKTALVGIVAAATVALVVTFLTSPLGLLPQAALAAVLVSAALNLFDAGAFARLARIDRHELGFALVAAAGVIWIGPLQGVFIAVVLTLIHLIRLASHPVDAVLGRDPASGELVTPRRNPDAVQPAEGVVYLFEASLFFLNADYFRERALAALDGARNARWLVIDASAMVYGDSSAVDSIGQLKQLLDERGIGLYLGGAHGRFRDMLERSGLAETIGREYLFDSAEAALRAAEAEAAR